MASIVVNHRQYSLFLHNCHLILLLRRQLDGNADSSKFQPTEWRWKMEEVCDGNWHQYAISFDLTEVSLIELYKVNVIVKLPEAMALHTGSNGHLIDRASF